MQKFLKRIGISVMLILSLSVFPVFAEDNEADGSIEKPSSAFMKWRAEYTPEMSMPTVKNSLNGEVYKAGHIPYPVDLSHLASNPPSEETSSQYPKRKAASIPATYDLRNVSGRSYVTSIKNQNPYGTCWAHAALGAMESNMLIQGKSNYDLSEAHLAWFTFSNSNSSAAFTSPGGTSFAAIMDNGGNSFYPAAMFARLSGPASETEAPYGTRPSKYSPDDYTRMLRLKEVFYLDFGDEPNVNASSSARDIVKRRIMENGAVVANYYSSSGSYYSSPAGTNYYNTSQTVNHAVQIVGWDDNYSRSNFRTQPSSDGAWLIKNSWGTSWGDNGYFWMSYSQYLTEGSAFVAEEADKTMKAYYYDALGWCGTWRYSGISQVYAANVFRSERDNESIKEVSFFTPDNNVGYEVRIYRGMSSMPTSSPIPSGVSASAVKSGTIPYAGYHTIALDSPVALSRGEYFSVVVKFTGTASVPIEYRVSGWSGNASIEDGSFFSATGSSWTTGSSQGMNACIKAFTVTGTSSTPTGIAPSIIAASLPEGHVSQPYSAQLTASGTSPITWSSSGNLPAGLSLNTSTGAITGTPTAAGNYTFTASARNNYGTASQTFTINVIDTSGGYVIPPSSFTGYVGYAFRETLSLIPSVPATWTASGTLPAGLRLTPSTGLIYGTPSRAGTYTVNFTAKTSSGATTSHIVTFTINPRPIRPTISISSLANGTVDTPYSQTIRVTGTEPITVAVRGQPDGLSLNGSNVNLSGTPKTAGTYSIVITAENIATKLENRPVTKTVRLTVRAKPPVIVSPGTLHDAIMGEAYDSIAFMTSSGTAPITWSVSGQPSGMRMSTSGVFSGTPARSGRFNMTVTASNAGGRATLRVPLTVLQKPMITTSSLTTGTTDRAYTGRLQARGDYPITWTVSGLPSTLKLTQNSAGTTATIAGTPVVAGTYNLRVKAENAAGYDERTIALTVRGVAPRLTASLGRATANASYTGSRIYATGTRPITITYSVSAADLARFGISSLESIGMRFTADPASGTATLSGTPSISLKNLPITFSARNSVSTATVRTNFTISGQRPVFTTPSASTVSLTQEINSPVNIDFAVTGTKNITFKMSGASGFTLTQTGDYTANLKGTAPARDTTTSITVTATNSDGSVSKRVSIRTMTSPKITTASLPAGTLKVNYNSRVTATGTSSIRWSIGGNLPGGITFSNGTLRGRPTQAGNFTVTLTATNNIGSDTKSFTLTVIDPNSKALPSTNKNATNDVPAEVTAESRDNTAEAPAITQGLPATVGQATSQDNSPAREAVLSFGEGRTSLSLPSGDIEVLRQGGYTIAAVLPEVSADVSDMQRLGNLELSGDIPAGAKLYWFAFPKNAEKSDDDEIAEFYDESGAEIKNVPENRKISVSAWLNKDVIYAPVIAVK